MPKSIKTEAVIRNLILIIGLVFGFVLFMNWRSRSNRNYLREQHGIDPEDPGISDEDIIRILRTGRKIDAIKAYRTKYGVQLVEAKEAIEYADQYGKFDR